MIYLVGIQGVGWLHCVVARLELAARVGAGCVRDVVCVARGCCCLAAVAAAAWLVMAGAALRGLRIGWCCVAGGTDALGLVAHCWLHAGCCLHCGGCTAGCCVTGLRTGWFALVAAAAGEENQFCALGIL